ncbi:MAG: hypothetical protein IKA87_01225 [Lentisphaeria bacterium]|nr:hypothetical protein [Lentisphaeria bacterium]
MTIPPTGLITENRVNFTGRPDLPHAPKLLQNTREPDKIQAGKRLAVLKVFPA